MTRRRKTLWLGLAAALLGGALALAPRPAASIPKDECYDECHKKQKDCMFNCAQIGDDAENKECAAACVKAYNQCTKACKKK